MSFGCGEVYRTRSMPGMAATTVRSSAKVRGRGRSEGAGAPASGSPAPADGAAPSSDAIRPVGRFAAAWNGTSASGSGSVVRRSRP